MRHSISIFLILVLAVPLGVLNGEEKKNNLAWLGYLRIPKKSFEAEKKVSPSEPLKWKAWKLDEGGVIKWVPRYEGYVNILGKSLKVLPKGPDPKTLSRRKRHQANP